MKLRPRFIMIKLVFSVLAVAAIAAATYWQNMQSAMEQAKEKGKIIFSFMNSQNNYYKNTQRPLLMEILEKERFYPELMSGFAISRGVWDVFGKGEKGIVYKQATIDPLWEPNRADEYEKGLISKFQNDPKLETLEGTAEKKGEKFYYFAIPKRVDNKDCLRCHGIPTDAPKDQITIYGTEHGYHWKMGDVVATNIVYVSLNKAIAAAWHNALNLLLISAGSFFIAILLIWYFLDRSVVKPIIYLSNLTSKISVGENLDERVPYKSDDEIGLLASGIDRLRISIVKLMERSKDD